MKRLIRVTVYLVLLASATFAIWLPWLFWRFGKFVGIESESRMGISDLGMATFGITLVSILGQISFSSFWLFPSIIVPLWMRVVYPRVIGAFREEEVSGEVNPQPVDWR